jgi:bacterioferritin-associated ferredoxin
MYVCMCVGVTSGDIEQCCREGARTVADLMGRTGAGTNCGGCRGWMEEHLARQPASGMAFPLLVSVVPAAA